MNIVLKDKIKVDKNFINDLITKSWEDSESIQNQINSINVDSATAAKVVQLLKDLLTSYYIFTGCLENIENEPIDTIIKAEPVPVAVEVPKVIPEEPIKVTAPKVDILPELDYEAETEPFEYFVDFDEPTGEPLTDDDLYN
jgi:hypothetical protein